MLIGKFVLVAVIGYLLGSIPFGLIISKVKSNIDIRNYGSGKTGGTNVLRTLGRKAFITVAALDIAKAVIGHIWPIFLKFKGGRGVATFLGGLIALYPPAGLLGSEALIIGAGLSGFASLGSIIGLVSAYAILIPMTILYGFPIEYLGYVLIGTLLIIFVHRDNIKRLLSGSERRLNQKSN